MNTRHWIGYNPESLEFIEYGQYINEDFERLPGCDYIEIFSPLHGHAVKLEKTASGEIIAVRDDEKWEKLYPKELKYVRQQRNSLLKDSDFSQLPDVNSKLSDELKYRWIEYRTKLRDITENIEDPWNVIWPVRPDEVVTSTQ
jgi:hypothetical protein